jgi:hypothetical protein
MNRKFLKKLKEKEEKLLDAIYELQELLDSTEDEELSSMGDEFSELMLDFVQSNDTMSLNDIREFIEESIEG